MSVHSWFFKINVWQEQSHLQGLMVTPLEDEMTAMTKMVGEGVNHSLEHWQHILSFV